MNETVAEKKTPPASEQDFPIVGIGASAGGIEAFKRFLKAIPEDSGMAYVLVQHLNPSHESILPDILRKVTKIPVNEITDDIHLAPNNIYVIPENKTLTSNDGVLKLTPRDKIKRSLPIDIFFISLAEVHQSLAVGIVLSGNASDGTLGLKSIKAHGGITFAQDQQSAANGDMPQNAVNADVVDFVLPPEEMPAKLLQLLQLPKDDETSFKAILALLGQRSGVDFTYYKQATIRRRIARRMAISRKDDLGGYLKLLRSEKAEQDKLFMDLLIPVTTFFRDPNTFDVLCETVFPVLFKNRPADEPIRAWISACSTGEEAYSLAICLHESVSEHLPGRKIQIFASDVSEAAIKKAREGIYTRADMLTVSEKRVEKYFTAVKSGYQVNRNIRDICVFAVHNFLKDPPFAKMDIISCRNVLIYMDTSLQKKALSTFHYALNEAGFLLLGKSETTGPASELFTPFAKNDKIYSRKTMPGRYLYIPMLGRTEKLTLGNGIGGAGHKKQPAIPALQPDFRKNAEAVLLSKYTPPAVIINEQMDIVHIHGSITAFLEPSQGKPSFNLLKMAREGLGFELRNTLLKARTSNATAIKENIPIQSNGSTVLVTIEVVPLTNTPEPHFLILFHKILLQEANAADATNGHANNADKARIEQLEKELAQTREDMRSISEDQEAANEELQSGNEELQSSSEELQSLNEELETSKEELQSTNEELIVVNQEMQDKQEEINNARLYAEAIIASVREPLLVLDKSFYIKTINKAFYIKFGINEQESIGKGIFEIKNRFFDNLGLRSLLEKVLPQRIEVMDYEIIMNIPPSGECTMLLNARQVINQKSEEQLILLSIKDISERKKAQQHLQAFSESLEQKVKERTASLEQTNLQLEEFAHTASHELQEPLRKIITFSKILKKGYDDGKPLLVREYLDKMDESSGRLKQLVQHLLNFATVTQHEQLFEKTNLNTVFNDILFDFELVIAEKKATLTSDKLPVLEVIPFQMNQLFYDLVSNALKFSRPGIPPVIHISCKQLNKEEVMEYPGLNEKIRYYEIIFKDNGIGFEQRYAKQIFQMFQKLSSGSAYAGTGIGLALCKKIVQGYHGQIFAEGKENEGASFHVILPYQQAVNPIEN